MKAFDRVTVRNVLGWEPLDVVGVRGEVLYPGSCSLANPGSIDDIVLKNDDQIIIPTNPGTIEVPFERQSARMETVEINGAVAKAAMAQFIEGAPLGSYLSLPGGFTPSADVANVVVHLSDGGLLVKKAGEAFNPEIPAGSIVVVTAKPIVEAE